MTESRNKVVLGLLSLLTLSTFSGASNAAPETVTNPLSVTSNGSFELGLTHEKDSLNLLLEPSSVTQGTNLVDQYGRKISKRFQSYLGHVEGEANSWVRLNVHGTSMSGVISRQGVRYQLEGSANHTVEVNRLSDQSPHSLHAHSRDLRQTRSLSNQPRTINFAAATPEVSHVVNMAVVVDSQYNDYHNGEGVEKALSIINSVDGIYREEFGIALQVATVLNITDKEDDPFNFGNVSIETMLRGLRDYRMQSNILSNASLVHLFTGNENSDAPVGLAWIDTACRTDGYDVGLSTPYRHEILLAAHEIAHNLGAKHDSDTACSVENDKVMWPYISSQTSQNFSSCTRSTIRQSLQNSCHARTIDLQVSLSTEDANTYSATIRNNDLAQSSASSTLTIDLPENTIATALNGDCDTPANRLECRFGTLLPGAEDEVRLSIENFDGQTEQELVVSIAPDDVLDFAQINNVASIYILGETVTSKNDGQLNDVTGNLTVTNNSNGNSGGNSGSNSGSLIESGAGSLGPFLTALLCFPALRRRYRHRVSG